MKRPCEPFPLNWGRNVDLMPVMSLQSKLNKDQELFYFRGHVSVGDSISRKPIETDLGLTIGPSTSMRNRVDINYGCIEPNIINEITVNEIYNDFMEQMPDSPDIVIASKGIIHPVPRNLIDTKELDGVEQLFEEQSAVGNRYRILRERGIPVINPYHIVRNELYDKEIIEPGDPCLKRIKGILKTEYILPSNGQGYNSLYRVLLKLERGLRGKIEGRIIGKNWWEDTAQPLYLGGQIDSTSLNVRICRLDDRKQFIGI